MSVGGCDEQDVKTQTLWWTRRLSGRAFGTGMAAKDSMRRFGDDLTELLLSFLSLSEKLRFECVSTQWQRLVFRRHRELVVKNFLHKMVDSDGQRSVRLERMATIVRKCRSLEALDFSECHSVANYCQMFALIADNCPHMTYIKCDLSLVSEDVFEAFAAKLGPQLRGYDVRANNQSVENTLSLRLLRVCRHLRELNANLSHITSGDEVLARNLRRMSFFYTHKDVQSLRTFVAQNAATLKALEVFAFDLDEKSLTALMTGLTRMSSLVDLNVGFNCDKEALNDLIVRHLPHVGDKCRHLKAFRLGFQPKSMRLLSQTIQTLNKHFRQLSRLELNIEAEEEFQLLSQSLSDCKRLTHLSLISTYNYVIKDSFFADIERHLPRLRALYIENANELSDYAVEGLRRLSRLQSIEFYGLKDHRISNSCVLQTLAKCPKIRRFRINYVKYR